MLTYHKLTCEDILISPFYLKISQTLSNNVKSFIGVQ